MGEATQRNLLGSRCHSAKVLHLQVVVGSASADVAAAVVDLAGGVTLASETLAVVADVEAMEAGGRLRVHPQAHEGPAAVATVVVVEEEEAVMGERMGTLVVEEVEGDSTIVTAIAIVVEAVTVATEAVVVVATETETGRMIASGRMREVVGMTSRARGGAIELSGWVCMTATTNGCDACLEIVTTRNSPPSHLALTALVVKGRFLWVTTHQPLLGPKSTNGTVCTSIAAS